MTDNRYDSASRAGNDNMWGLALVAVLMVAGGLALMVWDDSPVGGPRFAVTTPAK